MTDVDIEYLRSWIGRERSVSDVITPRLAASLDAVLDIDRVATPGAPAPIGIHWCLAPDIVPMRGIGADGHPARGNFLPPVPFPRRMWAGGELEFLGDFRIGDEVSRVSTIENVEVKNGRSGSLIFVTVRHRYMTPRGTALDERQDIVYRELESASRAPGQSAHPKVGSQTRHVEASPVLLFRYSAITFNGHRIHYDQPYVTGEEGYPGLIVHGPLQATLLLGLVSEHRHGVLPKRFAFRSTRPLFSGGRISLHVISENAQTSAWIADQQGFVTMETIVS